MTGIASVREAVELLLPAALREGGKRGPRGEKSAKNGRRDGKNAVETSDERAPNRIISGHGCSATRAMLILPI